MATNVSPCKGCQDRQTACHDRCAKYSEWKAELKKTQAREKEYKKRRREDFLHSEECKSPKKKYKVGKVYDKH